MTDRAMQRPKIQDSSSIRPSTPGILFRDHESPWATERNITERGYGLPSGNRGRVTPLVPRGTLFLASTKRYHGWYKRV